MKKKCLFSVLLAGLVLSQVVCVEVSEKKQIAVFSLSTPSFFTIYPDVLAVADTKIVNVFSNMGRFEVKGFELRFSSTSVEEFIEKIKKTNESTMTVDEKYRIGEVTFTEADFLDLVSSFIIVIPSIDSCLLKFNNQAKPPLWEAELSTSFSFISAKDSSLIKQVPVRVYGSGETRRNALMSAVDIVVSQLEYEVRRIEAFQLKSGIIEVMPGGLAVIELGRNMGISVGDEFSVVTSEILRSGHTITNAAGLIVINRVEEEVSYGKILYGKHAAVPGGQLKEIPRSGIEATAYGSCFFNRDGIAGGTAGLRWIVSRGFYGARPLFGVEVPITTSVINKTIAGIPLSFYAGGELIWYFGRFQVEPSLGLGAVGLVPIDKEKTFMVTHIGGSVMTALNWMFSDSFRLFVSGGYSYWYSIAPKTIIGAEAFGGITCGFGVTFKL